MNPSHLARPVAAACMALSTAFVFASPSAAATVITQVVTIATDGSSFGDRDGRSGGGNTVISPGVPVAQSITASSQQGRASSRANADYDLANGLLRVGGTGEYVTALPLSRTNNASFQASATISETITVTGGSGAMGFMMELDGFWNSSDFRLNASVNISNSFENFSITDARDSGNIRLNSGTITDQFLIVERTVSEGDTFTLGAGLSLLGGIGFVDFTNTAKLSVFTDPGVTIEFADSRFLAGDSSPVPAVPLPASALLLDGGLGAIGALRKLKSVDRPS